MARKSQADLLERVATRISSKGLIPPGSRVGVACSGGPDSTALLHVLHRLAPAAGWSLCAIHIDHRQSRAAGQAARQIRRRCNRWNCDFFAAALEPENSATGSSEGCLRSERYALLRHLARQQGLDRLATGHTADDQVETILMRILRGTGVNGLRGIPEQRADLFVRPLLGISAEQVKRYLHTRRLKCFQDPANLDLTIPRNRIRQEILPLLRQTCNPGLDQALLRLSGSAARDDSALQRIANLTSIEREGPDRVSVDLEDFRRLDGAIQVRVSLRMLRLLAGAGANLEGHHLDRLIQRTAVESDSGFRLGLQAGFEALARHGRLAIQGPGLVEEEFLLRVEGPGIVELPGGLGRLEFSLVSHALLRNAGPEMVFFDADKIRFPLTIHSPRAGDRIRPWGAGGSRKVFRMLMEAGVPAKKRRSVALLAESGRILWVVGLRRAQAAPVMAQSEKILKVERLDVPDSRTYNDLRKL